jgi:hypothetical protein
MATPQPWGGPAGFAAAWGQMQRSWNVNVQQRVANLQALSQQIRSIGGR